MGAQLPLRERAASGRKADKIQIRNKVQCRRLAVVPIAMMDVFQSRNSSWSEVRDPSCFPRNTAF